MLLYIDISAVSYAVPLIAGIVVAIGSWLYIHFKRAKSKVSKTLGIDENAHKEVEEDLVINEDALDEAPRIAEDAAEEVKDEAAEALEEAKDAADDVINGGDK